MTAPVLKLSKCYYRNVGSSCDLPHTSKICLFVDIILDQTGKQRKHLTKEQNEIMIGFMETHRDISSSTFSSAQGRNKKKKLLEELPFKFNSCEGGVVRTEKEWLRSWNDNKSKTKGKAAAISRHWKGTGGGPPTTIPPLMPWEERMVGLMSKESISGHKIIEAGVFTPDDSEVINVAVGPSQSSVGEDVQKELNQTIPQAGPTQWDDEEYLTDQLSTLRRERWSTPASSASTSAVEAPKTRRRLRRSDRRNETNVFEILINDFIKAKQKTNFSIKELASAVREGCKNIADALTASLQKR